jgi:DNA invertase Pin-like site-specific DNA recombinase
MNSTSTGKMSHQKRTAARDAAEPYAGCLCIIYCRVSSFSQAGDNSTSLEAQEYNAKALAAERGYRVKQICKEVRSAYNSTMTTLHDILSTSRNTAVVMHDVSRFCRNVVDGLKMLDVALAKNNTLVFVADSLTITNTNKSACIDQFTGLLKGAEVESHRLGERIKTAQKYLRDTGKYSGGCVPYGLQVKRSPNHYVDGTLIENEQERQIMAFIAICKKPVISTDDLNTHMRKITTAVPYVNIQCYDKDQVTPLKTINTPLTNSEIADILNDYHIKKRGRVWTAAMVKSVNPDATAPAGTYEIEAMDDITRLSLRPPPMPASPRDRSNLAM